MNAQYTPALIGIAVILAGSPAIAAPAMQKDPAPVRLESVRITQSYGTFNDFMPGLVTVAFSNQAAVTVKRIVFNLIGHAHQVIAQYDDVGTYPQGATFRHSFPDTHTDVEQELEVSQVTFTDGTVWSAPWPTGSDATIFPPE